MRFQPRHSGESRSPDTGKGFISATKPAIWAIGFLPRIKYGVTFFRGVRGDVLSRE